MPLEALPYADFSSFLHRSATTEQRIPINASIELTHRCNFACKHCYNNLPATDTVTRKRELQPREYRRIFAEMADAGTLWLLMTGGEIFVRPDFMEIYRIARETGFLITLFTNGSGISEQVADELSRHRPLAIEITLYGATRETSEKLTGTPGSFVRTRIGIERLMKKKLPLKLKTVVLKENLHELPAMRAFAANLGVEFKFDAMINPRLDGSSRPLATRLTPLEVVQLDRDDPKRLGEWDRFCEYFHKDPGTTGPELPLYRCGGGINSFSIDPYGKMALCGFSQRESFDLRTGSFRTGWEHFLRTVIQRRKSRATICDSCVLDALCDMCPAWGELENGDPEEPVDFLCHVAHLRAHLLGIDIHPHGDCPYCPGGEKYRQLSEELASL